MATVTMEEYLADQDLDTVIQQKIAEYFVNHSAEVITPAEWQACMLSVVKSIVRQEDRVNELEEDNARLMLKNSNDVVAATAAGRSAMGAEIVAALNIALSGASDILSPGLMRAVEIAERIS